MTKVFNINIFLFFIIILGSTLVAATLDSQKYLNDSCSLKTNINISMNLVLMLGIMLIVLSLTYFICNIRCKCEQKDLWYKTILGFIGIKLAVCGSIILDSVKDCNAPEVKNYAIWLTVTGTLAPVLLLIYHYNLVGKLLKMNSSDSSKSN
jgi:hypothetical protein